MLACSVGGIARSRSRARRSSSEMYDEEESNPCEEEDLWIMQDRYGDGSHPFEKLSRCVLVDVNELEDID